MAHLAVSLMLEERGPEMCISSDLREATKETWKEQHWRTSQQAMGKIMWMCLLRWAHTLNINPL